MKSIKNSTILLFILMVLWGCSGNNGEQNQIIRKVKVEPVQQADSITTKSFPGIIKEANEMNLAFRVAGPSKKYWLKKVIM